jgi:hypothetical protein
LEYGSRKDGEDLGEEEIMKSDLVDLYMGIYGILSDYINGAEKKDVEDRLFDYCFEFFLKRRNNEENYRVSVFTGPHWELEFLENILKEKDRENQKVIYSQCDDGLERMEVWKEQK